MNYLGSGERLGVSGYYRIQEEPKGSTDAVYLGKDFVGSEDFVVMYGDNYFKPYDSIKEAVKTYVDKSADGTILLHKVADPTRFRIVKNNDDNKVVSIVEKPSIGGQNCLGEMVVILELLVYLFWEILFLILLKN